MRALMVWMLVACCAASAAYGEGGPPRVGTEFRTESPMFGCRDKAQALLIRQLRKEGDEQAASEAVARALRSGQCQMIVTGAVLIFRQLDPNGATYQVRHFGRPDFYWMP